MIRSDLIARLAELHPQLLAKDAESAVKVILEHCPARCQREAVSRYGASAVLD